MLESVPEHQETGPYRSQHHAHSIRAIHVLDGIPEYGEYCPAYDWKVRSREPSTGTRKHLKWGMVNHADRTVEGNDE